MYIFIKTEAIGFTKIEARISFKGSTLIFVTDPVEEMSFFSFKTIVNAITKEGSAVGANNEESSQLTEVSVGKVSQIIGPYTCITVIESTYHIELHFIFV